VVLTQKKVFRFNSSSSQIKKKKESPPTFAVDNGFAKIARLPEDYVRAPEPLLLLPALQLFSLPVACNLAAGGALSEGKCRHFRPGNGKC
jgi:hypothetical protein